MIVLMSTCVCRFTSSCVTLSDMLIQRHTFTALSLLFFLGMLYASGMISFFAPNSECDSTPPAEEFLQAPCANQDVSHETHPALVRQGVSNGGDIYIALVHEAPIVAPALKVPNHARTLRAFIVAFPGRSPVLYLESVKPHAFYVVSGRFVVSQDADSPAWSDDKTLYFRARLASGALVAYQFDVSTLALQIEEGDTPRKEVGALYAEPE